jgi:hypothetical protein
MKHIQLFEQFINESSSKNELKLALKLVTEWTPRFILKDAMINAINWASEIAPNADNWKKVRSAAMNQASFDTIYMEKAQEQINAANFQNEAAELIKFVQTKYAPLSLKETELSLKVTKAETYNLPEVSKIKDEHKVASDKLRPIAKKYDKMCKDLGLTTPLNVVIDAKAK